MVKKTKSSSDTASKDNSNLASAVKDSAQQIWLAGMGAFSKAQEEGSKVFEALVKEGTTLQKKTQGMAEDKISEVTGRMTAMADTVTNRAGQNWDKLETIFEARTAKAMSKLGVPTAKDVDALVKRVDDLAAAVARLSKDLPADARTPRSAKTARASKAGAAPAKTAAAKPARRTRKTAAKTAANAA